MGIFQPRTGIAPTALPPTPSQELTKTSHYCVSRLPGAPPAAPTNGYTDHESHFALITSENAIHVWGYRSTDPTPLSIQFPLDAPGTLAILTRPAGTSQDPGVVVITPSGKTRFYESVQHAPALGLINNKMWEMTLPLKAGETVSLAQNVEPRGVAVATSSNRVLLVSLRDAKGKPALTWREISPRALLSFWGSPASRVVSIRTASDAVIVQESAGRFYRVGAGALRHDLAGYVRDSVDGYLPGTSLDVEFYDTWSLGDDIYLSLVKVAENFTNERLVLITVKIDNTGVLVYGLHRLACDATSLADISPKLFLPAPGKTAFVVVGNAVIITDIDVAYIRAASMYYQPRWEDCVRLKNTVEVVGLGYEDGISESSGESSDTSSSTTPNGDEFNDDFPENPALILLTSSGVLRVERFASTSPTSPLKSHIEQAIFYESPEIDFAVANDTGAPAAVSEICNEIMRGESPYLPPTMASVADLLALKGRVLRKLMDLVVQCAMHDTHVTVLTCLEKNTLAAALYGALEKASAIEKALLEAVSAVVQEFPSGSDTSVREFFSHGTERVNEVFTKVVGSSALLPAIALELVLGCLYPVYLLEKEYPVPVFKLWIFETDLFVQAERVFTRVYAEGDGFEQGESSGESAVIKYVELLYYFVNSAIAYMEAHDEPQLTEYRAWYRARKYAWVQTLISRGMARAAVAIAEQHRDFASVARLLEAEKAATLDAHGVRSTQYAELGIRYAYYFETYGYDFASALYDHYMQESYIQPLLLDFTNYKPYLERYFHENAERTHDCAWIRRLLDRDFSGAAHDLEAAATKPDDTIGNKELKLSVAKLALVQENRETTAVENALIPLRIQRVLKANVLAANLDGFARYSVPERVRDVFLKKSHIHDSFERLVQNKQLASHELIDYLTLTKVYTEQYADAFRVAAVMEDDGDFQRWTRRVWLRLLVLGDDWSLILAKIGAKGVSEKAGRDAVSSSNLYTTMVLIKASDVLCDEATLLFSDGVEDDVEGLNPAVETWVQSIRREVRLGKGDN